MIVTRCRFCKTRVVTLSVGDGCPTIVCDNKPLRAWAFIDNCWQKVEAYTRHYCGIIEPERIEHPTPIVLPGQMELF